MGTHRMVNHKNLSRVFVFGLIMVGIYSAWVGVIPEQVSLIPCLFHTITNIPCPGCGMTRACLSITQGNFMQAYMFNPFAFLLIALALSVALFPNKSKYVWESLSNKARNWILILVLVACLSTWVFKLL
ncbi:hypothetical protein C6497_01080 [Candidatus Poribacteria bacterium]|nr:MAG: hypothetical protein C6497_01080 [Candidatus Poribacteria bacterium]